tara:strand:+ start:160 stop:351 length:192 start_codon:yes stop_codon:yes gene_type:complete
MHDILPENLGKFSLSLFKKCTSAWNEIDISAYLELHHDDYEMTFHSAGEVRKLEDFGLDEWAD